MMNPIVTIAGSWIGTPYHHMGRVKGVGVDCAMLLAEVFEEAGKIPRIEPGGYPMDWHLNSDAEVYLGWVLQYADEVQDPMPGDIALYQFGAPCANPINERHTRVISHAAIVKAWPLVIHAVRDTGVILDEGDRGQFGNRLVGFWRIR